MFAESNTRVRTVIYDWLGQVFPGHRARGRGLTRMAESGRYSIAAMLAFTRDALLACGVPAADAEIAAKQMIEADLTGFDAHGIVRLGLYCNWLKSGRVKAKANIRKIQRSAATALVDGDDGIGHLVMTYAMNLAIELARESGIGWVGARNSNHAGAAGIYPEMAVAQGMVGIYAAVSTLNHMAPWGGAEPLIGTNPIAFAIPAGKDAPVVLDIATSVSSFGNIRQHVVSGKPLEEGWVVHSKTGAPITDPNKVGEGVLLPIGGHKGSGLALIIGLLAGVLNGAAFGRDVVEFVEARLECDQHRPVRRRARRVALHRAGCIRGRDGPASCRSARVADASGLRPHPHAGRGAAKAPRRSQRARRAVAGGAGQTAR